MGRSLPLLESPQSSPVHIGLLGRDLSDWHREWVSRAGAWLNIVALCWFALFS
jgi:hypothetical protein